MPVAAAIAPGARQVAACRPAARQARAGCRRAAAAVRAAAADQQPSRQQQQQQGLALDRRQALLGLSAALLAAEARPALADGGTEIFYGLATPPTSYGGYGGTSQNAKDDAKYVFEYPAGWKVDTINKVDKGTQGVDSRVFNPANKAQQVFVITLGRAGEDNRSFRITNVDATLEGFAGADYAMLDALGDAVLRVDEKREVDGQLYYDVEFASPDVHYLSSITVNSGKVYAMFVKSPERMFAANEAKLRAIRASFHTV